MLQQIFESNLVSVAILDRDMRFIKANRRYLTDCRLIAESINGRSFYDVFPNLSTGWKDAHRRCLTGSIERMEDRLIHTDGSTERIHCELQPWHDADGEGNGVLLLLEIITDNHPPAGLGEDQYLTIFQNNPQPMWIYDLDTLRFLAVNNAAVQNYGYTHDEFLQMTIKEIRPADDVAALLENVEKVTTGLDEAGCWRHLKKDGTLFFVDITSHTLTFDGRPAELVIARDVTDRKKMERELVEQKDLVEKILDNIPVMICTFDHGGRMTFANNEFLRVFDMTLEEIQAHPDMFSIWYPDPEYRACVMDFVQKADGRFAEFSTRNGSGKIIPTSFANVRLQDGTSIGIGLDITERKTIENERERLLLAIEQSAEVVMITDQDGVIEYVNHAFAEVTGYSREEVLGQTPRILKSGQQSDEFYREMWRVLRAGETWRGRLVNKRKDGGLYTEDACISPVLDKDGQITGYIATKSDITEQLQIEQQLLQSQKMESVGQLAGGVAHDFNNMLSLIIGRAELGMMKLDPSEKTYRNLHEIQNAANRSAKLTQQLLGFARKQTISPKVLDLNSCVESMLEMLRRLIGENIRLSWMPGSQLWPIRIDPAQLDQILTNLIVNARDAISDVGKITIESAAVSFDQAYCERNIGFKPGDFSALVVSDNGIGMESETLQKIFDPFFTTKKIGGGTGLGLSTVYGIVKQNNAFINVYSEPGRGSSFKVYFPRVIETVSASYQGAKQVIARGQGQRVLLVEDDPDLLEVGEELLQELGYEVIAANSAAGAISTVFDAEAEIDLLITDVIMPEMNGKELSQILLEKLPHLKILFVSGYTANVIAHHGVLDESVSFLQKPLSIHALATKLEQIFGSD